MEVEMKLLLAVLMFVPSALGHDPCCPESNPYCAMACPESEFFHPEPKPKPKPTCEYKYKLWQHYPNMTESVFVNGNQVKFALCSDGIMRWR